MGCLNGQCNDSTTAGLCYLNASVPFGKERPKKQRLVKLYADVYLLELNRSTVHSIPVLHGSSLCPEPRHFRAIKLPIYRVWNDSL